jgi:hypothetical protein
MEEQRYSYIQSEPWYEMKVSDQPHIPLSPREFEPVAVRQEEG